MLRGFWRLTWVEAKIFVREPMGVVASLALPVVVFVLAGGAIGAGTLESTSAEPPFNVAILASLFVPLSALISLVSIMSIYREGGILKRLRATPLSPLTILGAHVFLKLILTILAFALLVLAGRELIPGTFDVDVLSFTAALLLASLSILSLSFVIASVVPTVRFARPLTGALTYGMLAISGIFFPVERLAGPLEVLALSLPTTHAATLMQGIWDGAGWDLGSTVALLAILVAYTMIAARVFRWE